MRIIVLLFVNLIFGKMSKKFKKTLFEVVKVIISALLGYFGGNAI